MGKYSGTAARAAALIRRKGVQGLLERDNDGYDPITQVASERTRKQRAWLVQSTPGRSAEQRIGSLVNRHVMQFVIALEAVDMPPEPGDTLTVAKVAWKLVWCAEIDPAADGAIVTTAYGER